MCASLLLCDVSCRVAAPTSHVLVVSADNDLTSEGLMHIDHASLSRIVHATSIAANGVVTGRRLDAVLAELCRVCDVQSHAIVQRALCIAHTLAGMGDSALNVLAPRTRVKQYFIRVSCSPLSHIG